MHRSLVDFVQDNSTSNFSSSTNIAYGNESGNSSNMQMMEDDGSVLFSEMSRYIQDENGKY